MAVISKDLGAVTAYAAAVNRGYTGTKEEFETLMASYATVAQQAAESAGNASQSAQSASQSATDAETAKGTAQQAATDAQSAQASAQESAQSAQQSAQSASQSAQTAESAKETAVNAVDGFAAGAQQALDGVNQAGNNWKSLAQAQKLDAEAWAVGKRDGADVGSSDETYHNNAKYYAESAATDATTASDAAQTATQKAGEAAQSASAAAESARTLTIDATLTQAGQAADAKKTGDKISELNSALNKSTGNELFNDFVTKHFITNNESTYDLSTPSTDNAFCYIVIDASEGDVFTIKGVGGFTPRLWSFVDGDTSGNILSKANASATGNDLVITAPTGTTHLIVNSRIDANPYVYRGLILEKRVYDLEDKTSDAEQSIDGLELFALGVPNGGTIESMQLTSNDFFQGLYGADSIIETSGELASTKRIGLTNTVRCVAGTKVTYAMDSNQLLSVKVFANPPGTSQTALQESPWLSGTGLYVINYNGYLIVNVRRSGDAVIAPADYASVVSVPEFVDFDYISAIKQDIANTQAEISGTGSLPYYGEKIKLDSYTYSAEQIGSVAVESLVPQSSAIYGNELFTMYTGGDNTKTKFSVYNLLTNTVSGAFYMDSDTPYLHCNSACFGNKQNNSDEYPLLYINSYMDNNVGKGVCYVEKIIKDGDAYTTEQVQRIAIDFADQEIWTGKTMNPQTLAAGNWIVDTAGNRLIAYTTQGFDRTRFFVFELPDVSEANVTLTQSDILDYFDVAYIANIQDSCLHNGMIYLTSGIDWGDYDQILRVYAINLSGRCIVSEIPLEKSASVMRTEPEGIDYYNGALIMTTVTKRVMRLVF